MIILTDAENITAVAHCATTPFLTGRSLYVHTKHAPLSHYTKQREAFTMRTHSWIFPGGSQPTILSSCLSHQTLTHRRGQLVPGNL